MSGGGDFVSVDEQPSQDLDLVTVPEAAKALGVHPATVYRWIQSGELRVFRLGKVVRVRRVDIAQFVREHLS